MTTSAYMPDVRVEVALDSGYSTPAASRNWTDVSAYVELDRLIDITHGRADEFGVCEPNKLSVTLDNTDGRFTAARQPVVSRTNFVPNPSFEVNTTGWIAVATSAISRVTTQFYGGTASLQVVCTTVGQGTKASSFDTNTPSQTHTGAVWVKGEVGRTLRIDLGERDAADVLIGGRAQSSAVATGAWQRLTVSKLFGTTGVKADLVVFNIDAVAHTFYVDAAMVSTSAVDYFDGATANGVDSNGWVTTHAWTGTADASASTETPQPPYLGNIKIGRPIRVQCRWPLNQPGNMHPNPSVETNITGWGSQIFGNDPALSVAQSATRAFSGTKSVLATWPTTAIGSNVGCYVGLVVGRTYIASMYVWVPTGSPDVRLDVTFQGSSAFTALKDQWVRLSVSFTATLGFGYVSAQCASATSGQTCYVDAVMVDEGTTLNAYTATPPPITDRYVGYVEEWPTEWDGTDATAYARISAYSRTARLGAGAELASVVSEEYLLDADPVFSLQPVYFPLGEPTDSTAAGDDTKNGSGNLAKLQLGAGGELNFGANTGPGTDSMPAPAFLPVSVTNGLYLSGAVGVGGVFGATIEGFMLTTTAVQQTVVRLRDPAACWVELSTTAAGEVQASDFNTLLGAGNFTALVSPLSYNDGATHHVALTQSIAGGTVTCILYVDGVNVASTTYSATFVSLMTLMTVGGHSGGALFTGTISHVAAQSYALTPARILAHATAGLTGFTGETAATRITRLAGYAGIPSAELSMGAGTSAVDAFDTTGRTALDNMRTVEATETGVLFDGRDNRLTFVGRAARYNVASAFTLSAASQQVEAGLVPNLDRSKLVNDVTATATGGITARVVNQASIDAYGYARATLEVAANINVAQSAAAWIVNIYGVPQPRVPSLAVDWMPLASGLQTSLFAADVGTRLSITGLPSQASASSIDFFIEGYTETIGPESYDFTFNLSPVTGFDVWILEDATYGAYDTYPLAY